MGLVRKSQLVSTFAVAWFLFATTVAHAAVSDWTLMVYIAGDNNLEQAGLIDLDEIEAGMPAQGVEVIVFMDRAKGYSDAVGDWTDARVLRMRPNQDRDTLDLQELVRLGEVNTGDPDTLRDFVRYATQQFPSRRYGVVLWDHGGGWQGMADDEDPGDGKEHDNLSITEVGSALRGILPDNRKLDLIGFDMCLMAQLEMAYEMADVANYMVASQAVEPSYGWPWDVLLPEFGKSSSSPRQLAKNIVRRYADYTNAKEERIATQSAFDLTQLRGVTDSLDALADKLSVNAGQHWPVLSRSLFWADSFEVGGKAENLERGVKAIASSDLGDIVKRMRFALGNQFPAEREFQSLMRSMERVIIDSHVSNRHRRSHGMAIYAPPNISAFNKDYLSTRFGRQSRWPALLQQLHKQQAANSAPPKVTKLKYVKSGTAKPIATTSLIDDTTLKVQIEGANVLWVSSKFGRYSPENKGHLIYAKGYLADTRYTEERLATTGTATELLMPEFRGNVARMEMEVSPTTYAISNGEIAAFATLDISAMQIGQSTTFSSVIRLKSKTEGEHLAVVEFDVLSWEVAGVTLIVEQKDGRFVPRGVNPSPEDEVTLLFRFLPDDGEPGFLAGETFLWKDGLELIMDEIPPGQYRSWATAENLSGEKHTASVAVQVTGPQQDIQTGLEGAKKLDIKDIQGVWSDLDGNPVFSVGEPISKGNDTAYLEVNTNLLTPEAREYNFFARLDNRLLPNLQLITIDKGGKKIIGRDIYILLADANQPNKLWIKTFTGGEGEAVGEIVEVVRTSGGSGKPTPQASPLIGIWEGQSNQSYLWVQFSNDGKYHSKERGFNNAGQIEVWGRYAMQGANLQLTPKEGQFCNNYGCQPHYEQTEPPFPITIQGDVIRTPIAMLKRQR